MPRRFRVGVTGLGVVLGTAAMLLLAQGPAASAHDYPVSSSPAANSTVTRPVTRVSVTFDSAVRSYGRASTALLVTGPNAGSRHFESSCASIDGATVSAAAALGGSGTYTMTWRVVSDDGHPVSDSIQFTYRRPAGTRAASGTRHGPSCGLGSQAGASPPTAAARGALEPVVWIAIGVGAAVLVLAGAAIAVAVLLLRRRGRPVNHP